MSANLVWLESLQGSGIRPGLGRMRAMLRALRHPERAFRSIIIAGTNGKGSTSATLASILTASGATTGLYTSPHLVDLRERWLINGRMIDAGALNASIDQLIRASKKSGILPTYFEALTLIAFIAFREAKCEIAVLEVGMGGRLDATNVVRPIAALITPIGFDHTEFLGGTLRKIATEKAGVIHRGAIVLTTNTDPAILEVLRRRAEKFGDRFIVVEEEHRTPLRGDFQRHNVALAVRAARELGIDDQAIAKGVARTRWRGRLERIEVGDKIVWIDGFHNGHAVSAILPFIEKNVRPPRLLVFGMMRDKPIDAVVHSLFPLFDRVIATEPYLPRSASAGDLVALATKMGIEAKAEPKPERAFDRAMRSRHRNILIGGSLYLAGAAIAYFDEKRQRAGKKKKR